MWEQLTPADFGRARRLSNLRRTETLNRQKRELVELLAKHASEIELLDEKHAQIDELEELIVSFLRDCHIAVRACDKALIPPDRNHGLPLRIAFAAAEARFEIEDTGARR